MKPLLVYLFLINALSFLLMLIDKQKAKKNLWRIPEAVLLWTAALGGSLGALIGMQAAHHKTQHLKFAIGLPLLFFVQCIAVLFIFKCL